MNNNTKAVKSGVWYTASDFITKSIGLITTPIFTRLLTHAEYGGYNTYVSWLSVLTVIATLQLSSTFISARFDFEDDFDSYVFSSLVLSTISAVLCCGGLIVLYHPLSDVLSLEIKYVYAMALYLVFYPAISMFQVRERYYFKYKMSVLISMSVTVGTSLLSVLMVLVLPNRLDGRIFGSVIPIIALGFLIYIYLADKGRKVKCVYWKYAIPICLPYIPHLLSMSLLNQVDRIMITNIINAESTALYSVAYSCGALITMLLTSLNTAYAPWLGEKLHENNIEEIRVFSKKYIFIFALLAYGVMLLSPEILLVTGGKSYLAAKYVMPPVACGCIFQFIYTMYVNIEQFKKKTVGMAIASISAAVLNYVLNYIFIPRFGYVAAAYTTLVGYLWLTVAHMFLVKRIGFYHAYNAKHIYGLIMLSLLLTVIMNILLEYTFIRWVIIVVYGMFLLFVLIKHKTEILSFLKKK